MADNNYYEYYDEEIPMASSSMGQEAQPSTYKPTSILNALKHANDVYQGLVKAKLRMNAAGLDNPVGRAVMPGAYYAGAKLITDDNYTWDDAAREALPLYDTYYDGEDMSPEKVHQLGQEAALWFVPGPGKGRKKVDNKKIGDLADWAQAKADQYDALEAQVRFMSVESHPSLRKAKLLDKQVTNSKNYYNNLKAQYDDAIAAGDTRLSKELNQEMSSLAKDIMVRDNELTRRQIENLDITSVGPANKYGNKFDWGYTTYVPELNEELSQCELLIFNQLVDEFGSRKAAAKKYDAINDELRRRFMFGEYNAN